MESPIAHSGRRPSKAKKKARGSRTVYPLDITGLGELIAKAKRKTRIKNKAALLRLSIERGLVILEQQLNSHLSNHGAEAAATIKG